MSDLAERLKRKKYTREDWHEPYGTIEIPCDADDYNAVAYPVNPDGIEAAARITELEAALKPFADLCDEIEICAAEYDEDDAARNPENWAMSCQWEELLCARAALAGQGDGE